MSPSSSTPAQRRLTSLTSLERRRLRFTSIAEEFAKLTTVEAGMYGRASVDISGQSLSVDAQKAFGLDISDRQNWNLPLSRVWIDNNIGASKYSRKKARSDWDKAWAAVENRDIHVIILTETSRGSRTDGWNRFVDLCEQKRVMLCIGGSLYDPGNTDQRLTLGISSEVAKAETRRTHDRVLRGKWEAAEAGRPHGKVEDGFRRVYGDKRELIRVEPVPERVAVAEEIMQRIVEGGDGNTQGGICADLNRRGLLSPTGKPWKPAMLRALIRSPRWIGQRPIGNETVKAVWDPMIDEELWWAANQKLDQRKEYAPRSTAKTLLTGLATCGSCKAPIRSGGGGQRYRCHGWGPGDPRGMGHVTIARDIADKIIMHAMIACLSDPRIRDIYQGGKEARAGITEAYRNLDRLDRERKQLEADVEAGQMPARLAVADYRRIEREMAEWEARSRPRLPHPLMDQVANPDPVVVAEALGRLDLGQRRDLFSSMTSSVVLLPLGKVGRGRGHSVDDPKRSFAIEWERSELNKVPDA